MDIAHLFEELDKSVLALFLIQIRKLHHQAKQWYEVLGIRCIKLQHTSYSVRCSPNDKIRNAPSLPRLNTYYP